MHWEGGAIGCDADLTCPVGTRAQPGMGMARSCLPAQSETRSHSKSARPAGKLRPALQGQALPAELSPCSGAESF